MSSNTPTGDDEPAEPQIKWGAGDIYATTVLAIGFGTVWIGTAWMIVSALLS